jgi:hypothetical protein
MQKNLPVRAKVLHDIRVPSKYATEEPQTIMSCRTKREDKVNFMP